MQIIKGPIKRAQRVVVYGPEGIGKSTFASKFPNPVFIDTEGSTYQLDVARFPKPTSWQMLLQQVQYVRDNPDTCRTLIIDTADWAEALAVDHICARFNKGGIEEFGYGKGYVYLAEEFGKLLNLLNDVVERGIHVVLVAHAQMRKFELPDESGAFDRWELKLQRKTAPLVKEWADMVLFINYKTYVVEEQGKHKARGGKRMVYTSHHPVWDAKNRHGLPPELDLDYAAISHIFEVANGAASTAPVPMPAAPAPAPEPEPAPQPEPAPEPPTAPEPAPEPAEPNLRQNLKAAGVPDALIDLMEPEGVTLDEIQAVVAARGYFPIDTPFRNYPEDFVNSVLIAAWPQVLKAIKGYRDGVPF